MLSRYEGYPLKLIMRTTGTEMGNQTMEDGKRVGSYHGVRGAGDSWNSAKCLCFRWGVNMLAVYRGPPHLASSKLKTLEVGPLMTLVTKHPETIYAACYLRACPS
ncbi:hypothetical protein PMIN06_003291 [Paraphaeosphaeria minitans]|uniref:Uncharacterized protein n=1 Tax=Paraphaeosphaeria minitans TaxID=565426 RepID=A0A9P6G593_9PLEO|nr:hypothetical protein PMIN01_12777 [Paraphaeosphaeria minitans]